MNTETTAKVGKKKGGKMKFRHMMIEPTTNGAISTVVHDHDNSGDGPYRSPQEVKTSHTSMGHLKKHVASTMAAAFPSAPSAEAPGTGGGGNGGGDKGRAAAPNAGEDDDDE